MDTSYRKAQEIKWGVTRSSEGLSKRGCFTLYVDNIPEDRDHRWLAKIFSNYGVVKDAFIPWKKSKNSGRKFGFVWFESRSAVEQAILKLNGVWLEDKRLFVKEASFGQNFRPEVQGSVEMKMVRK